MILREGWGTARLSRPKEANPFSPELDRRSTRLLVDPCCQQCSAVLSSGDRNWHYGDRNGSGHWGPGIVGLHHLRLGATLQPEPPGSSNGAPVLFPYSPIANVDTPHGNSSDLLPSPNDPFGFTPDVQYDLKWPGSPTVGTLGRDKVPCAGDNNTTMVNRASGASSHLG
jgi:hypothetical protein